ncbi:NUDIX domain-containing protein [Paenibacillus frigoriresistens]|uniref:NUDIX domain-containing protein n=1 Tax=Paenibacillus alginolyticus TaxID=59839 RepID=UPI001564EEC2|nr:NUDIX domain-containing protein [Paenibacillus frigoriresistens]
MLLVKHNDNSWGLPGGLLEPGESVEESIRREFLEELEINIGKCSIITFFPVSAFIKSYELFLTTSFS